MAEGESTGGWMLRNLNWKTTDELYTELKKCTRIIIETSNMGVTGQNCYNYRIKRMANKRFLTV